MSLTDLMMPSWVRAAALAVCVALIFGAGVKAGAAYVNGKASEKVSQAERLQLKAENDLSEYKRQVREASADQATAAARQAIKQTQTTQESASAYINHRGSLEQRIAGGLRLNANQGGAGGCSLGPVAKVAAGAADRTAQSVPAEADRNSAAFPEGVASSVPAAGLIDSAALDAQQLAHLIDTACKLGLCAVDSGGGKSSEFIDKRQSH